ncbi:hypothetical protein MTO96_020449 [Rhipicephalus appendiculatus]
MSARSVSVNLAKHISWMAIDAGVELRFIDGVYRLGAGESLLLALLGVGHMRVRLTVLDLTGLAVEAAVAERIVDALLQNDSVTDLAVGSNIFASGPECKSSERFAMYLTGMKATLRRLYLDAHDMTEESNSFELWATLVQAIGKMTVLEELVARGLREGCRHWDSSAASSSRTNACAFWRVIVEDPHVGPADVKVLRSHPEASAVTISSSHFPDLPSLCGAIHELAVCQHITSLRLRFDVYDEALYSTTAYVMAVVASTVRDMELYAKDFHDVEDEGRVACQNRLIEAVASNRKLTRLKLHIEYLNATCCQFVADCVLQSTMLCQLSLEALVSSSCAMFLWYLLPGLMHNYRLLDVTLPDYGVLLGVELPTLHDVTRRNRGLVELASRFVMQNHGDPYHGRCPYGESALQLVAEHPKLAETIAQKACIPKTLAESMIKQALELAAPSPNV